MSLKKRVLQTGAAVALSGLFAFSTQSDVDAAEWQPRTVSEIESEIESQSGEYTFKTGDTLWGISEATGISVNKLSQINNLEGNMIIAGNSIHLSNNNNDVISVEEGNQVESYDVSDQNVEKTGSSQETDQQAAAEQRQAEQAAAEQRAAEQEAAEQRQAEQEAAEQRAAQQAAAEERAAQQEQNQNATKGVTTSNQGNSNSAKAEIARRESGGSGGYTARNGQYIGKYQLDSEYLNGDYSPENQERVAEQYVQDRYGSWDAALEHHNAHNWY